VTAPGIVLLLGLALSARGPDDHLMTGARHFREGRFDAALVEFRVAERLGATDAAGYAGASLVKLRRPEEALEAFAAAGEGSRDALLDYYRALACYDARLFLCADRLLASLGERSGPRIAEQTQKVRADIAAALAKEPAQEAIDWYLARCSASADEHRPALAAGYCREAAALADRRNDRYRRGDALAVLARLEEANRGARR
jgi:hypothetical protein